MVHSPEDSGCVDRSFRTRKERLSVGARASRYVTSPSRSDRVDSAPRRALADRTRWKQLSPRTLAGSDLREERRSGALPPRSRRPGVVQRRMQGPGSGAPSMDYGNEEEASALREMAEGATRPSCGGSFRDRMLVWHHGNKWFRVMFRIDALSTPACGVLKEALGHGTCAAPVWEGERGRERPQRRSERDRPRDMVEVHFRALESS